MRFSFYLFKWNSTSWWSKNLIKHFSHRLRRGVVKNGNFPIFTVWCDFEVTIFYPQFVTFKETSSFLQIFILIIFQNWKMMRKMLSETKKTAVDLSLAQVSIFFLFLTRHLKQKKIWDKMKNYTTMISTLSSLHLHHFTVELIPFIHLIISIKRYLPSVFIVIITTTMILIQRSERKPKYFSHFFIVLFSLKNSS